MSDIKSIKVSTDLSESEKPLGVCILTNFCLGFGGAIEGFFMAGLGFCSGGNEAALGGPLSIKSCRFMNLTGFGANFGIFGASRNILFSVLCCTLKG